MVVDRRAFILDESRVAYVFDVCTSEEHADEADVTEHPVEVGVNITDHVRRNTSEINLEVVQSNYPIYDGEMGQWADAYAQGKFGNTDAQSQLHIEDQGPITGSVPILLKAIKPASIFDQVLNNDARAERFYVALKILKESAALLKVYTSIIQDISTLKVNKKIFSFTERQYVIKRLRAIRDEKTQSIIKLSIALKELRFVTTRIIANTILETKQLEDKGTKAAPEASKAEDGIARNATNQFINVGVLGGREQDPASVNGEEE